MKKIYKSVWGNGKKKGILVRVPVYEEFLFKMNNPIHSGIQKNTASGLFVKEWIGSLTSIRYHLQIHGNCENKERTEDIDLARHCNILRKNP